jgi:hypothetical protein
MNNKIYEKKLDKYKTEKNNYKIQKYKYKLMTGGTYNIFSLNCHGAYLKNMVNCGDAAKLERNNILLFIENIGSQLDEYKMLLLMSALKYNPVFKENFYKLFQNDFAAINREIPILTVHIYTLGTFYLLNELFNNGMNHELFMRLMCAHLDTDMDLYPFPDEIKKNPCYGHENNLNLFVLTMNPIFLELLVNLELFNSEYFETFKIIISTANLEDYVKITNSTIVNFLDKPENQINFQIYKVGSYIPYYEFNLNNVMQITNENAAKQHLIYYNDTILYGLKGGVHPIDDEDSLSEKYIYSRGNLNFTKNLTTKGSIMDKMSELTRLKIMKTVDFVLSQFNDTYPPQSAINTIVTEEYIIKEMINSDYKVSAPYLNSCSLVSYINSNYENSILILGCCGTIINNDPIPHF